MLRGCKRLDTSTQGEYTKSKPAFENVKDFNVSKRQSQILPLRPDKPLRRQTGLILAKLCSHRRATVMATDCAPVEGRDPEMENGSHIGGKRQFPISSASSAPALASCRWCSTSISPRPSTSPKPCGCWLICPAITNPRSTPLELQATVP